MIEANLSHPSELARQVAVFGPLKQRRQHQSNIWFFDSPKNNSRLTIHTDVAFMHFVILEGDRTVARYVPRPAGQLVIVDGIQTTVTVDAQIFRQDGAIEWWDFKGLRRASTRTKKTPVDNFESAYVAAAAAVGATYRVKTDADLAGHELLFDNWLTLCAAINRCRHHVVEMESQHLFNRLRLQESVTLDSLLKAPGVDRAYMLAVIGIALQNGAAFARLDNEILNLTTVISRRQP